MSATIGYTVNEAFVAQNERASGKRPGGAVPTGMSAPGRNYPSDPTGREVTGSSPVEGSINRTAFAQHYCPTSSMCRTRYPGDDLAAPVRGHRGRPCRAVSGKSLTNRPVPWAVRNTSKLACEWFKA